MPSRTAVMAESPARRPAPARRKAWPWTVLGLVAIALLLGSRGSTPEFRDPQGRPVAESIASLERVRIGGTNQWILIRGVNRHNPILLVLHGGPGLSLMPLAYKFQGELEKNFVVVEWDQRGAGKSYSPMIPAKSLNEEQLVSDAHDMIEMLRERFQQPKIFLMGHSWGTYLGMVLIERYPQLFYAYVGAGQVGDSSKIPALQKQFVRDRATKLGDQQALEQLENGDEGARKSLVVRFGGDVHGLSSTWPLVRMALHAPEYNVFDYARYLAGLVFYYRRMPNELRHAGPAGRVSKVDVPIYFFTGDYDEVTPTVLTEQYFNQLQAPKKELVHFENSAHFPFLEEPERFAAAANRLRAEILGQ